MDELRSLYESLVGGGYYSKSFEEFQKQFKDPSYQDKVYGVATRDGLFSKSKDEFLKQYAVGPARPINEPLKKKDPPILPESPERYRRTDGESSSGVGSSALSGTDPNAPAPVDPLTTMYTPQFERSPIAAQDNTYVERQVDYVGRMEKWMRETQEFEALREQSRQEELAKAQEQEQVFKSQNLAANKDEDFQKYLGDVNANLISKKEEEVVPELNRRFGSYGFHFEEAKPGRDAMYVRTADGKHEMTIFLNLYKSATEVAESKRLRDFLQLHAQQPEREKSEDYIGKSLRAKSMRDAGRLNDDGTYSTVKFTSYEEDGKHYVIPTLFPKDPDSYTTDKKDWMELPFEEALNEARNRGEIFEFETDEEAKDFAEGDWKDVNAYDIEGQKFYKDRGLDYYAEQKKFKNYSKLQDELELIERIMDNEFITPQEKLDNPKYFSKDGTLLYFGEELKQEKDEVMKKKDNLLEQVFDIEFFGGDGPVQKAREDFDVVLEERRNEIVGEAIKVNSAAKQEYDVLNETALKYYNVPIEKISTIVPKTPGDAKNIENLTRQLVKVRTAQQTAATNFEIAKTYYDAKWNKAANTEYEENWAGFSTAVSDAWKNGKAAEQILLLTLGMKDVENIEDREEVARLIVEYLSSVEGSQSRVLTRLNLSRDGEFSKSLLADPFETMLTFAASSFAQMAPYGLKIVPSATATGAAGGAALGSLGFAAGPAGFATTTGGAITGGGYGLRTGMAATMLAMEYTNSILDVMREKDYNLMDPKQVEAALMDETVWSEGSERGVRRGIPIAIVDYLSSGLAGRVFNTSRLASTPVRVGAMVAERAIFDPAAEAAGEYVAQEVAGQEIEWKEIAYEALGGLGNNTSMMAYNLYKETRNKTNTALAYELTDINRVANESVSDERISRWANNMHQLGKIDADVNQRIQENVGLRREAREITSVGRASRMLGEGRKVESRVMELLAAKKELTKSSNLKEIYRERISAIDQELAVISETKKTLPGGPDVRGDGVTTAVNLDAILGTTREGVSNFKIGGKTLTRQQFLKELENMNDRRLLRARVNIENDEEVESLYAKKVKDAIQKQSTGEVSVQSETGVGEEMEGGTPKTELEVTTKEQERKQEEDLVSSKTRLDEIAEAIPERVDYTENDLVNFDTLEENKTRGVLAALAEKVAEGTKLSDVEQTVYDANKTQVDVFSDLAAERTAIQEEVSDLEAMLGRRAEFRAEERVVPANIEETTKALENINEKEIESLPFLWNHSTQKFNSFGEEIEFEEFTPGERIFRIGNTSVQPIWFSKKAYATGNDIRQIKTIIDAKKTFDFNNEEQRKELEAYASEKYGDKFKNLSDIIRDGNWESLEEEFNGAIPALIKEIGYDSYLSREGDQLTVAVFEPSQIKKVTPQLIAESYKIAKENGTNPELVKAVESLVSKPKAEFRAEEAVTPEVSEETQVEEVAVQEVATAPKLVRDISVLITPATVRSPSNLTKRIKALSIKYDKLVKQFSQKKDQKTLSKIKETEAQILNDAKQEIIDEVSKIKGVSVSFGSDKRGLWDGSFEPSFNMILSISTQADTEAVSKLLFDFSEKYSQDAFILETDSNYERDVTEGRREIPLTEFDDNKLMHYPQIVYTFDTPITDEQVADLSVALQENGIDAFSINNNEIKISVIKFFEEGSTLNENEQYEERTKDFKSKSIAAATATSNILGGDGNGSVSIRIKKSSYQGAKNERTTDQFRKYDRSDVLKPFQETVTDVELLSVELANLRKKQIQLQEKGKQLSKEEQERFDELQKNVQPTIQKTFEVNKAAYEEAKSEVEKIAEDAIEGTNASLSPFPIKRPERASVKAIRWYNSFTEKLGDGARVNIVVESEEDADKIFDLINKKYPTTKGDIDLRRLKEVTELGYPKRLIELRTSNGIIAEIQVITNEAYLAKDGISGFTGTEQQKNSAKKKLSEIRKRLGWSIPDGMGHYFYEIQRDVNVDEGLRSEALRLSNIYYDAFTNPESTIDESFMDEVIAFKNKVDLADKSNWDKGNEGKSPAPLIEYINQEGRAIEAAAPEINELLTADTKDKTTLEKVKDFLDKIDDDLTQFGNETAGMNIAIPVMKAIIKTVKALVSTGITLQEAIQRAASENNVTEQDVIDSINALAEQRDIQGKPQGVSEMELPGYNRMISELEGVIEKSRKRGNSEEKVMENAMAYLQGSKVYQDASDTQRERMVRDVRKVFGKREKAAPKPKKIFGEAKDVTMITMSEYDLLKKQLRDFGKGAKNAKMVWMRTSQALTKYLKEMVQKGFVSTKQVSAILRKFSAVNMFDEKSIERFVDYMEKVFKNADYAEQIAQVRAMLPRAKKNAQTKIGVAQTLSPLLNQLFAINPTLIPDAVFDKYLFVVSMMGERKTVLDLAESGKVTDMVEEVLNAVDEEVSMSEELAERFDAYEDKVVDEDGKIDYAETVKKMLKDDVITEEEASIMRKYKSNIMPMVAKEPMTEEEIAAEKAVLVGALKEISVDSDGLPMKDERNLARELAKLIKTDAVESLNITQLNNLLRVIGNINNGYLPHFAQLMVERLTAINNSKTLNTAVSEAKPLPLTTVYTKLKSLVTGKDKFVELIRRNPLFYIDQVFGNFKTKAIYNAIFERAAEAQAMFKRSVNELNNKLEAAEDAVAKSFKYNGNKTTMSKYKMMTFMVQLEYNSNPNNDTVNPAAKYLKKTIKHIRNGKTSFSERDANMLEDILDNFTDENGEIDNEKLYNSFNQAEKNAIKTVQDINAGMREKALYTAAVIRGDKIHPLNNYIHLNVLHEHRPDEAVSGVAFIDSYNNSLRSSTKAKSLIARTGKVAPINFDVFASANRGARYVLMDYYLTEPIRTARKTINETSSLLQEEKATRQQRDIFNAIDRAFEEAVDNLLISNFTDSSFGDKVVEFISKQGYRAVLASIPRFIGELSSNISFAIIAAPKDFKAGVGYRGVVLSADASRIMGNVGSKQTNRLFPHDTLSGRLVDTSILEQASGVKGSRAKNDVANKIQQIYNLSLKKYQNVVELMADSLIATPDKMVMRPMWFGSFANEFKRLTGREIDFDKVANNDEAYMADNKEALDEARNVADTKTVLTGATDNAFMGVLKGTIKENQRPLLRAFNTFNNFMTNFLIYEYMTARTGVTAAMGNGSISRKQGVALLGAVSSRMVLYSILTSTLSSAMVGVFVDDEDEDDDKSFLQKVGQAVASSLTAMVLGRDFGNATKAVINQGVEYANQEYLDFLREGEYDPYKDAIQYTVIPPEKKGQRSSLADLIMNMMGPFGPAAKTADLAWRKATEEEKKKAEAVSRSEQEMNVRLPLEVLGNIGMIPLYKDVRKIVNAQIYKDINNTKKEKPIKGMGKEDMKRYFPDMYNELYGPGGSLYDVEKMERELNAEKRRIEREIKDEMYNYVPKKNKSEEGGTVWGKKEQKGGTIWGGDKNKGGTVWSEKE